MKERISSREVIDFQRGVNRRMVKMWKNKMPTKVRVFMWLVIQDRIQTEMNLNKKEKKKEEGGGGGAKVTKTAVYVG